MTTPTEPASTGSKRSYALGSLEARLMEVLWGSDQQLSVQEVCDRLQPTANYKTAMTVLNRLVEKELLTREMNGRAYDYRPSLSKRAFLRGAAEELVNGYIAAYGREAAAHLEQATTPFRSAPMPVGASTDRHGPMNGHGPERSSTSPMQYLKADSDGAWRIVAALLFAALVLQSLLSLKAKRGR